MQLKFKLLKDTKTCYRFECRDKVGFTTLYLKKDAIKADGISPENGIVVGIKEDIEND